MPDPTEFSPEKFGATFQQFMKDVSAQAPKTEPVFAKRLREHFGTDASKLPEVSEKFTESDLPNVQLALDAYVADPGRTHELVGVVLAHETFGTSMAQLASPAAPHGMDSFVSEGSVQLVNVTLDHGRVLPCVKRGLYLIREGARRLAVLMSAASSSPFEKGLNLEVLASDRSEAEAFLGWIRAERRRRSVYRGKVVSLSEGKYGPAKVDFHDLPQIARADIILPAGILERIERLTVGFSANAQRLAQAGRHLKRGLLLHGPPGTGKTLTAMHLAGRMKERTVILLTGHGLGMLGPSCAMARSLQPATLILEDVDLVAESRARPDGACNVVLFDLLNHMDGLDADADILFLLTTNRPDILEPALASRPGRIDQAFEIPLPDADCRRRLFALYGKGLDLRLGNEDLVIQRTEGASPAFIRELLRKAALVAADEAPGPIVVRDAHVDEALHELVAEGGALTRSLLGFRPKSRRPRDK